VLREDAKHIYKEVSVQCIGHWKPPRHAQSDSPRPINLEDGEHRDLSFFCTMVGQDPDSPDRQCYFFYCDDVTLGPSNEECVWKVEPKVAAQVFVWFLHEYFDLRVTRHGTEYDFKPINIKQPKSSSKGL